MHLYRRASPTPSLAPLIGVIASNERAQPTTAPTARHLNEGIDLVVVLFELSMSGQDSRTSSSWPLTGYGQARDGFDHLVKPVSIANVTRTLDELSHRTVALHHSETAVQKERSKFVRAKPGASIVQPLAIRLRNALEARSTVGVNIRSHRSAGRRDQTQPLFLLRVVQCVGLGDG